MELRHLRYFVAVAEDENIGSAARRLHLSPSPLSRQLQQLEEEIGVALLARVGRGVQLTDAGRVFRDGAQTLLAEVARCVAETRAAARGDVGHLAVAFVENVAYASLIPEVVTLFRARHPGVNIELLPMSAEDQVAALRMKRISAAFTYNLPLEADLRAQPLFHEPVMLILPHEHSLARRRVITAHDLQDEPFIWMARPQNPYFFDQVLAELKAQGINPRVILESRSTAARLGLVASGVGLTFALESSAAGFSRRIVARRIKNVKLDVRSMLAWRTTDESSQLLRTLRDVTEKIIAKRRNKTRRVRET